MLQSSVAEELLVRASTSGENLRVWVVGCATGQEAYSLAMVLEAERQRLDLDVKIQIFATDIHEEALRTAAEGFYSTAQLKGVSQDLLDRFFRSHEEGMQVRQEIRALVAFARHNMLADTPFTRIDFVSCRNSLIYLTPTAQQRALWALGFCLRQRGVLLLGNSETPGFLAPDLEAISSTLRIFRRTGDTATKSFRRRMSGNFAAPEGAMPIARSLSGADQSLLKAYDMILDGAVAGGIIVDQRNEILHVLGRAREWIQHGSGRTSLDVHSVIGDQNLRLAIGSILRDLRQPECERAEVIVSMGEGSAAHQLLVQGRSLRAWASQLYFVQGQPVDRPVEVPTDPVVIGLDPRQIDRVAQIERELAYTRESLQSLLEEQETSNEELNAANEELIASNEELQSSNEELSALNEELRTLNDEHHRRLQEVLELTADLEQILTSTDIGILLLNEDGTIRRFSDPARDYFHVVATDQGRPFSHIRTRFDSPEFVSAVERALGSHQESSIRVSLDNGEVAVVRVGSYSLPHQGSGVAISAIGLGAAAMSGRESLLQALSDSSPFGIAVFDEDRRCVLHNDGDQFVAGEPLADMVRRMMPDAEGLLDPFTQAAEAQGPISAVVLLNGDRRLFTVWPFEMAGTTHFGTISHATHELQSGLGSWVESQSVGVIAELLGLGAAVVLPDGTVAQRFSADAAVGDTPALDHPDNLLAISDLVASAAELGFNEIDQRISMVVSGQASDVTVRGLRLGAAASSPYLLLAIDL